MKTAATLLGSSPTLDGIRQVVKAFYCGESKELRPATRCPGCNVAVFGPASGQCDLGDECQTGEPASGETLWSVHKSDGTPLSTVVRLVKGRYRFERKTS